MKALLFLWTTFLHLLIGILRSPIDFIILLVRRVRAIRDLKRYRKRVPCLPLPPDIVRKPDPLIYCQSYLQSLGIAVTWDNPDIHLEKGGNPVDPHDLQPDTDYNVHITVHNGSNEAPAPGTQVSLSYRKWGIAGPWNLVTQGAVDLPVRGAAGEPATIILPWHTPSTAGHYCLLAILQHANDLNPANNFGQTNTDIKTKAKAQELVKFDIPIIHSLPGRRTLRLEMTSYRLPAQPMYPPVPETTAQRYEEEVKRLGDRPSFLALLKANLVTGTPTVDNWSAYRVIQPTRPSKQVAIKQFAAEWLPRIVDANAPKSHPAAPEWLPTLSQNEITLDPGVEAVVQLTVQVPPSLRSGARQPFQVNAIDSLTGLIGGVEVIVEAE
jgi:hypothetical protein